jgi:hypothetical protein
MLNEFQPEILNIQITADKENGIYESDMATANALKSSAFKIYLLENPGYPLLLKYLDTKEPVAQTFWSNLIARNRFAGNDESKLQLPLSLFNNAYVRKDFRRSTELIDCDKLKVIANEFTEGDSLSVSLYPSFELESALRAHVSNRVEGATAIRDFILKIQEKAKVEKYEVVSGVLFVSTTKTRMLQYCKIPSILNLKVKKD